MKFKYYIISFFTLLVLKVSAQSDTSSFKYHKPLFDFQFGEPVFNLHDEQVVNKNRLLHYYALTGYREGVEPIHGSFGANFASYIDRKTGIHKIVMYNLSIADMVTHGLVSGKIVLDVKDPSKYQYDPKYGNKDNWMRKNAHCYEFALPIGILKDAKLMNADLSHLFGIKFGMEERTLPALILIRTSNNDKIKSAGKGEGKYDMLGHFNNINIDRLGHPLREAGLPPMVDETNYKDPVDLDLKIKSWSDLSAVRAELHRYDLDLIEGVRKLTVFVIKEK